MLDRCARLVLLFLTCVFSVSLGDALPAQGKTHRTKAEKRGPKDGQVPLNKEELAERLEKFKAEIASKMVSDRLAKKGGKRVAKWLKGFNVIQSKHYLVYTNGPKTTVKRFSKSLEQLYEYVRKCWPFKDLDHRLDAYIFKMNTEYFDFCVKIKGWPRKSAEGTAGHAMGAYYATFYQSPKSNVVMHEATHQIVNACMKIGGVGSWFQEGMAAYIEKKILGAKVSSNMRSDLRNGNFYSLRKFVAIETLISDPGGHGTRCYDHAGALIEFMVDTKEKRMKGRFPAFLEAARKEYGRGAKYSEDLIREIYGMGLDEVQEAFALFHRVKNAQPRQGRK